MYEKELIIKTDYFSVCFNAMQIQYQKLDDILTKMDFLNQNDEINLFLNVESLFHMISAVTDVERKIYMAGDDFPALITSKLINYAAHYKSFFRRNGLRVKVFLYMTDFNSYDFNERKINEDYRLYYLTKYNRNPKYMQLSDNIKKYVIPTASTILQFIDGVYFVDTLNLDASQVPFIIASQTPKRKNIIISSDFMETQYSFLDNFRMIYLKRSPQNGICSGDITDFISYRTRIPKDKLFENHGDLYQNKGLYLLLLSVLGDKYRTIDGINRVGYVTLTKKILQGLQDNIITENTDNYLLLSNIMEDDVKEEVQSNLLQINFEQKMSSLSVSQIEQINSSIVDRVDVTSLQRINQQEFYKYNLNLEALTM